MFQQPIPHHTHVPARLCCCLVLSWTLLTDRGNYVKLDWGVRGDKGIQWEHRKGRWRLWAHWANTTCSAHTAFTEMGREGERGVNEWWWYWWLCNIFRIPVIQLYKWLSITPVLVVHKDFVVSKHTRTSRVSYSHVSAGRTGMVSLPQALTD